MSHGPVDVFAAKDGVVRLIQVKSGSSRMKKGEIEILKSWGDHFDGIAEIWYFKKRGKLQQARCQGVEKLFRKRLLSLLRVARFFLEAPNYFHFFMASLADRLFFWLESSKKKGSSFLISSQK